MRRRLAALLITSTVIGLLLAAGGAAAQEDDDLQLAVRDTRLEPDGVTELVVNVTGSAKPDVLPADAFSLSEQGEPVEGLTVEPLLRSGTDDVAVSLAIDISSSMAGERIAALTDSARVLAEELTAQGVRVQIIAFDGEVEVVSGFSDDTDAVVTAIESLQIGSGTALYDAAVEGIEQLEQAGRIRTLVAFADGEDNRSDATLEDVTAAATAAEVPVYVVFLETDRLEGAVLETLTTDTGGRLFRAEGVEQIAAAFEEVASDLASQYLLRYTSARFEVDTLDLEVAVAAGGTEAVTSFVVPNTRDARTQAIAPRTLEPQPGFLSNPLLLYLAIFSAFLALLLVFSVLFTGSRGVADRNLDKQLARYIESGDMRAGRSSVVSAHFRDRAMELLEAAPRPKGFDAALSRRLEQAAWPLKNGEFVVFVMLSAVSVFILVGVTVSWLGGLLLGLIAGAVPFAILQVRLTRRHDRFLRQLPDTLQLMAGSLRAGYGVLQAIDSVAKESSPPTSEEFGRVLTEARLGMAVEDALQEMAERIDNADFRWVVMAVNIQREVGGNLAELLDTVAEVLREREMLRRQIKVLSAEGRLSAWILIGLPIVLALYLILVRPDYIGTLVTSGMIGWMMVVGAGVFMAIGVAWIRKLIRIEV